MSALEYMKQKTSEAASGITEGVGNMLDFGSNASQQQAVANQTPHDAAMEMLSKGIPDPELFYDTVMSMKNPSLRWELWTKNKEQILERLEVWMLEDITRVVGDAYDPVVAPGAEGSEGSEAESEGEVGAASGDKRSMPNATRPTPSAVNQALWDDGGVRFALDSTVEVMKKKAENLLAAEANGTFRKHEGLTDIGADDEVPDVEWRINGSERVEVRLSEETTDLLGLQPGERVKVHTFVGGSAEITAFDLGFFSHSASGELKSNTIFNSDAEFLDVNLTDSKLKDDAIGGTEWSVTAKSGGAATADIAWTR